MIELQPKEQVVGVLFSEKMPSELVEELMALIAYWLDKNGFPCFCCGENCETASVSFFHNQETGVVAAMVVPSCETCATELEDGSEALYDLFISRVKLFSGED